MTTGLDREEQHLVSMAHQIAANVPAGRDVPSQVCAHLTSFWSPVMRQRLAAVIARSPGAVTPEVAAAVRSVEGVR